jgi:hypothetical protein
MNQLALSNLQSQIVLTSKPSILNFTIDEVKSCNPEQITIPTKDESSQSTNNSDEDTSHSAGDATPYFI